MFCYWLAYVVQGHQGLWYPFGASSAVHGVADCSSMSMYVKLPSASNCVVHRGTHTAEEPLIIYVIGQQKAKAVLVEVLSSKLFTIYTTEAL
jgi:hypothetical protein